VVIAGAPPATRQTSARRDLLSVLGLVLLATAVRVPTLAQQSFWLDEAYTEGLIRMSFGGMLHAIPTSESTPPVYYMLAWGWTHVFGHSEFGVRSLSALAGILTVPVVYVLALRLADRKAALIAGTLVALSPLLIWYSQEARAYALATFLSTVSLVCLVGFLDTRRFGWLVGWTASSALGLATHYFVGFVVGPELAWLLWRCHQDRRTLVAGAVVLAVAGALVPLALAQRGTGHADYIAQGSLATRLLQIPKQLLTGYASPSQLITAVLAALLAGFGTLQVLIRYRSRLGKRALIPLAVGVVCVLFPVGLALVGVDFVNTRNLLPALPLLLVVIAIGFAALESRPAAITLTGILGLVFIVVVALVDTNPRYQRDDWRGASRALGPDRAPRAIVLEGGAGGIPLEPYLSNLRPLRRSAVTELDVVAIPRRVLGGGIGTPPRPLAPLAVPAGFRLTRAAYSRTYTVLRFTAPRPITVTAASLASIHLGGGAPADLIQR
jgi:mannosyltransferase